MPEQTDEAEQIDEAEESDEPEQADVAEKNDVADRRAEVELDALLEEADEPPESVVDMFDERLRALTPRLWVMPLLIAANLLVYLLMIVKGVHPITPTVESLLDWGANYAPRTIDGQWSRLITCTFIHIGALHILFNMYVLWDVGRLVERLLGPLPFAVMYFLSGAAGSIASMIFNPNVVSAGASGAVFGVFGALLGVLLLRREGIPIQRLTKLRNSALAFVIYNTVFALQMDNIDMAAHMGGLAMGFLCGMPLSRSLDGKGLPAQLWRTAGVMLVFSVVLGGILQGQRPRADFLAEMDHFAKDEKACLDTFNDGIRKAQKGELSDDALANILSQKVIPQWRSMRLRMAALRDLPKKRQQRMAKLLRYLELREEGWVMFEKALRQDDRALAEQATKKQEEAQAVLEELNKKED